MVAVVVTGHTCQPPPSAAGVERQNTSERSKEGRAEYQLYSNGSAWLPRTGVLLFYCMFSECVWWPCLRKLVQERYNAIIMKITRSPRRFDRSIRELRSTFFLLLSLYLSRKMQRTSPSSNDITSNTRRLLPPFKRLPVGQSMQAVEPPRTRESNKTATNNTNTYKIHLYDERCR